MAIAYLATVEAGGGDSGTTGSVDTTGATLLVVIASAYNGDPTITDSKGNTWNSLTSYAGTVRVKIYYASNPTVGTGHTFSWSGGTYTAIRALAYSGVATTSPYDVENGATSGGATTLSTGSVTPSQNDSLIVAGWSAGSAAASNLSINASLAIRGTVRYGDGGSYFGLAGADYVQGTAAAINPAWSWTGSDYCAANIAVFKPTAGGSGVVKTVDGLAFASVKTVNGLTIASVKTINGNATA